MYMCERKSAAPVDLTCFTLCACVGLTVVFVITRYHSHCFLRVWIFVVVFCILFTLNEVLQQSH